MLVVRILILTLLFGCKATESSTIKKSDRPKIEKLKSLDIENTYMVVSIENENNIGTFGLLEFTYVAQPLNRYKNTVENGEHIVKESGTFNSNTAGKLILNIEKFGEVQIFCHWVGYFNSKPKKLNIQKGDSLIVNIKMIEDLRPIFDPVIKGR